MIYNLMEYRSRPPYIMKMRKEPIMDNLKDKMISRYKKGGLKNYEEDVAPRMGKFRIEQIYHVDTETKERLKWVYVGEYWWCRKRKKGNKGIFYEFARLVAIENTRGVTTFQIVGLWDARRHEHKPEPPIVTDTSSHITGVITSHNEFEIWVKWENGKHEPISDRARIEFKYIEDNKMYSKIFDRVEARKNVKKVL